MATAPRSGIEGRRGRDHHRDRDSDSPWIATDLETATAPRDSDRPRRGEPSAAPQPLPGATIGTEYSPQTHPTAGLERSFKGEVVLGIMNVNDFVILPGSKAGTSVRLKTKTVKELQLEKAQLEAENKEMERRLLQLQSNMSREKEERRKLGAYHWKSGQAGPRTPQTRTVAQNNENRKKVSPQRVKLQVLKQIQEPVKKPVKPKRGNVVAHEKLGVKGVGYGPPEIKGGLLEPASASTSASPGKQQDQGLLLSGAFDERASAESFQEALLQWRRGESGPGGGLCAREVPSEAVGNCEVQTNVSALKEPIHVEFQKDGLSYMEKLLLKKYRRTPVDQFFASCMKDSRPVQALSVQQDGAEGGGQGDDDDDDDIEELTDEEVKKYWASIYRAEESNTVSENAESSLQIEFLDDSQSEDLEESSDSSVEETGDVGMNKQGKTDPLEGGRNPVSPKEISQEKLIVCSDLEIDAVQEESIEPKAGRGSLGSCGLAEEISEPTEGVSKDPTGAALRSSRGLETELQQSRREPQELGRDCNTQSLVLPGTAKSSALQDVAKRQKCGSASYQGLEGFFVVGANPKQEKLEAPSSLPAASSPRDRSVPFPGDEQWVSERSLSECADDSVVQGVLESQLNRAAKAFQAQNQLSHLMAAWMPWPDISGHENHSSLACEDGTSSSRAMEKISGNADFQSTLELKDHDPFDIFGDWEESQMDAEEAILEDKQQVLALQ
ncbi:zinc finger B-box domain-containing protein 1 isoform X4 [Agelaius tricolor]|uniref:zinc finger B-box domain-containing protein 1 isoform X4 n=1 Tax=Agelaius tricolor TaxID=9191 RepID=UPI0039F1D2A2